ncbi:MAG TPA: hypothetical protein VFW94_11245 [Candidatus Acidoferrales bacterium]|nr:hypothetical protein [Candidatus Acidoferrales bacterium]
MRLERKIVAISLLVAMLLPGLTFLEFLELTTFHDDPSNAFILKGDADAFSVIDDGYIAAGEIQSSLRNCAVWPRRASLSSSTSRPLPQDLLALLSLWRT